MALGKKAANKKEAEGSKEEIKQRPMASLIIEENGERVLCTPIWGKVDSKGCINMRFYQKNGDDEVIVSVRIDGGRLANGINAPEEGEAK